MVARRPSSTFNKLAVEAAYNLDTAIGYPDHVERLRDMDLAIKVRTGASKSLQWQAPAILARAPVARLSADVPHVRDLA